MALMPRQPAPLLRVPTADGDPWSLGEQSPENMTMIVVYRGLHCPICATYLRDLDRRVGEFSALGVDVITLSSDPEERARRARDELGLRNLRIGYGLDPDTARRWGLFISSGRGMTSAGVEEPAQFAEPGLFLVRSDGTLYASAVQTMPFARPHFADVLKALEFVIANNYPARGEVVREAV